MSVQFKFREDVAADRRQEIVDALDSAGFSARSLFPGQKRARLASIFTIQDVESVAPVRRLLANYGSDIEYLEAAPTRTLKG